MPSVVDRNVVMRRMPVKCSAPSVSYCCVFKLLKRSTGSKLFWMLEIRDFQVNIQSEFLRYNFDGPWFGKTVCVGLCTRQHIVVVFFNVEVYGRTGRAEVFNLFFSRK